MIPKNNMDKTYENFTDWDPSLASTTVERVLEETGFNPEDSRRGINNWVLPLKYGTIKIEYHEGSGMIAADTVIGNLEDVRDIHKLLVFLLIENEKNLFVTLSLYENQIVLSLIIYDVFMDVATGKDKLEELISSAEKYNLVFSKMK